MCLPPDAACYLEELPSVKSCRLVPNVQVWRTDGVSRGTPRARLRLNLWSFINAIKQGDKQCPHQHSYIFSLRLRLGLNFSYYIYCGSAQSHSVIQFLKKITINYFATALDCSRSADCFVTLMFMRNLFYRDMLLFHFFFSTVWTGNVITAAILVILTRAALPSMLVGAHKEDGW